MQKSLNNLLIIKGFFCDPGAIQTHDLQNRNLTLYSLSYGAIPFKCDGKSIKKLLIILMFLLFLYILFHASLPCLYYFETLIRILFIKLTIF